MQTKDFLRFRRDELRKFFELTFGNSWPLKVHEKVGGWMSIAPARLQRAEELARLHGFVSRDENQSVQALERNFLKRLRILAGCLENTPEPLCHTASFWHILDEFFAVRSHRSKHKRKHKDEHTDVIPLNSLVFDGDEQRTVSPAVQAPSEPCKTFADWLALPLTLQEREPPGPCRPEGGEVGPPISLSGSSETCGGPRVEDYEI